MTRFHLGQRVRRVAPWLGAALLLLGALGACNYRWVAVLSTFQFKTMDFVSVFPAHRDENGNYERQCTPSDASQVNSLLFSVNLVGTEVGAADNPEEKDNDTSIRPGDLVKKGANQRSAVKEGDTISEEQFRIDVDCLETYPDPDLVGDAQCQGQTGPRDATPKKLNYRSNFADELRPPPTDREAMALAVVVDQSGSMKGFVETETELEVIGGSSGPWDTVNFKNHASDADGHRITAIRSLFNLLNPNDRAGVFQFSESVGNEPAIVCDLLPQGTEADRRKECFGTNHKITTDSTAFTRLLTSAKGRTPLWSAVSGVYDFVKNDVDSRVRHILVISDGPDTCHPDSPDFQPTLRHKNSKGKYEAFDQKSSCSEISYEDFLAKVEADLKDADGKYLPTNRVPVHVSFLQFQAPGYLERDARQQEIACRTGGQYLFVNAQDLEKADASKSPLRESLLMAVQRLRGALAGTWTLAVDVPDLANGLLPLGSELAVQGVIKLIAGVLTPDAQFDMRVGYVNVSATGQNIPRLDMRGAIRVPCAAGDSCSWYTGLGDCEAVACRGGDLLCEQGQKPDQTGCGTGGACCWGGCVTPANDCQVFDTLCNPVNAEDNTTCSGGVCCAGVCQATCP